ncbi:ImmA/IrrE family metallo-endopeptidase [Pediococcus pentosaceus]|uniref:ImmA/IrrE family metallo-endopeptidase n=1 Tax=Pediococcus pentosaceus TaxID=1255 RepID=UPI0039822DD8
MTDVTYATLFSEELLQLFPDSNRGTIESLIVNDDNPFIDVERIVKEIDNLKIEPEVGRHSGELMPDDENGYVILFNEVDSSERQRFTIAHELGHYLFLRRDHQLDSLLKKSKYRNYDVGDYSYQERKEEITANNFAADLLMPVNLIQRLTLDWIKYENDGQTTVDESGFDKYVEILAGKLRVSRQAFDIRMKVLGVAK